jgi:hypothetical protein
LALTILLAGSLYTYFPAPLAIRLQLLDLEGYFLRLLLIEAALLLGAVSLIISLICYINKLERHEPLKPASAGLDVKPRRRFL